MDGWWLEAIGWIGSAVLVVSLLQTQVLRLRLINLIGCVILIGYNAVLAVWPMVGLNAVLAIINVVYLWRMVRSRHDDSSFQVLQVAPNDGYLQHILDLFAKDISGHHPDFRSPPSPHVLAFLVQSGAETVGVVLVEDAGNGEAQVLLDWVTPAYRDLSPGEFVYRTSGLFTDRGFATVASPPHMVKPYYSQIGFREEVRDGARVWVLDLG